MLQRIDCVSQLPPEILGEILIHCTASNPDSPALLSTVSHRFHEVISSTPRVWKELHLSLINESDEACTRKTLIWFRRAATCSVRVTINIGFPSISTDLLSPHILRSFSSRTECLTLQASSQNDAQEFVSIVFCEAEDIPLKGLTITIKPSDSWHPPLTVPTLSPTISTSSPLRSLTLPKLPKLEYLDLSNIPLPDPSRIDLRNLKSLTVIQPIRSSPIHLSHILRILRSTPQLLNLEIQGRITDSLDSLPPNSTQELHEDDTQESEEEEEEEEEDPFAPLTLPTLTDISIRSNHIPQFLAALIMPELNTLRFEDLDGHRINASEETGKAIRQMLVRMDLPRESRTKGSGLKVFDMSGVSIKRSKGKEEGLWEWCFKRMWFLEELQVKNINVDELMEVLIPQKQNNAAITEYAIDDTIVPRLNSLSIIDNHISSSVERFQKLRPMVDVKYEITNETFNHSYLDFIQPTNSPPPLSPSISSASSRGFGFGSPFDRRRLGVTSHDKKH